MGGDALGDAPIHYVHAMVIARVHCVFGVVMGGGARNHNVLTIVMGVRIPITIQKTQWIQATHS